MAKPHSVLFGLSDKYIARICRVSLKTAQRWKKGQSVPGYCEIAMLTRDLGSWDADWSGWAIRNGQLISPEGLTATPGEVRGIPYMTSVVATYQAEFRRMREEADALEEQPLPGDWHIELTA